MKISVLLGFAALFAIVPAALATHFGPVGSLHIEVPPSANAFDFESPSYVDATDPAADIRLGLDTILGYQELLALNGAGVARLGLVDFATVGCGEATGATYDAQVGTLLPAETVPTLDTVFLVKTGTGTFTKLLLTLIDFTQPNGLGFDYELLACAGGGPPTPIGGIGLLPSVNGIPLEAAGSSGPSASVVAGVVGAIAAGALALGGAAWYARRRSG